MAWLGIMRRVDHMLNLKLDFSKLEKKSNRLIKLVDAKIDEIEESTPDFNVHEFLSELDANFEELSFQPVEDFWEEELGRLFDNIDQDDADQTI